MCVPACQAKIARTISRRNFLSTAGVAAVSAATVGCTATLLQPAPAQSAATTLTFERIVDLTHTMPPNFPTYFGEVQLEIETVFTAEENGFNLNRWHINEHTGTHLDAPFHFSDQDSADAIPVENLVGPLCIVDIRAKAEGNPDAQVTPDELAAWEAEYGELPEGAIVAMNSGWDAFVNDEKYRNADDEGALHFPGFHVEATQFLMQERNVKGIMVDTLSLDFGLSPDFAVHFSWLPTNRWGIENVANLGELPANGATVIVGGPKVAGATGGPSRVIALV
ncbi:cyclase family protein [Chloroflexi bacterium TSY]|nr:cyclase family protein [Chloroflexi bacterium TSY]